MSEYPPTPPGGEQPPRQPGQPQPGQQGHPGGPQQGPPPPGQQPHTAPQPGGSSPGFSAGAQQAGHVVRNDAKGFFGSLFDYSFTSYITPKIVKIVYVIVTVLIAIGWFFGLIAAFSAHWGAGIAFLLLGWIVALIYLALARITLEFYVAVINVSQKVNLYARRDGIA